MKNLLIYTKKLPLQISLLSAWSACAATSAQIVGAAPLNSTQRVVVPENGLALGTKMRFYQVPPQSALNLTDEVTLEAWIQADRMDNAGGRILDKSIPFTLDGYVLDTFPGNSLRFSTRGGAISYDARLPDNQWTHVVGVYSARQKIFKLYVNGREVAAKTDSSFAPMTTTPVPLRIGADSNGENVFRGHMAQAAIYERVLNSSEIAQRFAAGRQASKAAALPGLLGDWRFAGASAAAHVFPFAGNLILQKRTPMDKMISPVSDGVLPMETGKFEPNWESLQQYETPEWYRDAKFGIWAHWGPQCEAEAGDWYARHMYVQGDHQYNVHREKYGPQSQFGFKDVIHEWKAENWNPDQLMALYKRAGAQYFFALANHHDNFDLWDSQYQPWNSVNMGPKKDLIAGWAKAARAQGMKFGVSVHAAHTWTWMETSRRADKNGPNAGISYDGNLTKADGAGKWWEGYDPQELYAQNHPLSARSDDANAIHSQWNWGNGANIPDVAYCDKFYNRTVELINKYNPDLVYFDDTALPLWPISDAGLKIAAHLYNHNIKTHNGQLEAVLFGKILDEEQRKTMVWDIERGQSNTIEPQPWQSDTCIGSWHYDRALYERNGYKSAKTVIQTLADVVSKNGNLLLSVPVRGDGTIDEKETAIVEGIADWMKVNSECIFGTRPWKVFGEGPASEAAAPLSAQGFNEGKGKPFSAQDVRFTTKGNAIYAIVLGQPEQTVRIKSLGKTAALLDKAIEKISLLGSTETVKWTQERESLAIEAPQEKLSEAVTVFKIMLKN